MKTQTEQQEAVALVLLARWEHVSQKIEQLARKFSEQDYEWRPREGVRSCGEVIRHVAFWNQYVRDCLSGKQADDSLNELPAAAYPTKATMVEALRDSAEEAAAALRARTNIRDLEVAELLVPFLEHTSEHYGQLATYARLRDLVPPASQA